MKAHKKLLLSRVYIPIITYMYFSTFISHICISLIWLSSVNTPVCIKEFIMSVNWSSWLFSTLRLMALIFYHNFHVNFLVPCSCEMKFKNDKSGESFTKVIKWQKCPSFYINFVHCSLTFYPTTKIYKIIAIKW